MSALAAEAALEDQLLCPTPTPRLKLIHCELLGEMIKQRRLSQQDVASSVGCSRPLVSLLTNGRRTSVHPVFAVRLCAYLHCRLDALFDCGVPGE